MRSAVRATLVALGTGLLCIGWLAPGPVGAAADSLSATTAAADSIGAAVADSTVADSTQAGPPRDPWRGQNEEFPWYCPPKPPPEPEKEDPYADWDESIEFTEEQEGLFKIHRKRQEVHLEIAPEDLERTYLLALTLSRGIGARRILGGSTMNTAVVRLQREGDAIRLVEINPRFRADENTALARSVDLSYGESVLFSFPIVSAREEDGHILVDLSSFLLSDYAGLEIRMAHVIGSPARIDRDRSTIGTIKSFPQNLELDVSFTFTPAKPENARLETVPDARYIPVGVHYSLSLLEETGYRPRLADSRLGYFLTVHKDFSRDDRRTYFRRYINRWHLVKQDSAAELCEPVEPIIFYIDHTVPEEYVPWVKEGIELWQGAFEAAGFKNAIQAIPAPDDPDFAPEDVRYNTVRWAVSSEPSYGAIGPSRVDPRTGQILDADVLIEASLIHAWKTGWSTMTGQKPSELPGGAVAALWGDDAALPPEVQWLAEMTGGLSGHMAAELGEALALNGALAHTALVARGVIAPGEVLPDSILGEAMKWLVCHEVGHTLGLRHNFKSSSTMPYEKLHDRDYVDAHGFGSVMEYVPPNIALSEEEQGYYYRGLLGEYDYWVIRYGYTPIDAETPEGELPVLQAIAAEAAANPGLAYATDEDAYIAAAVDPLTAVFDISSDPLAWRRTMLNLARGLLSDGRLEERALADGDDYMHLRNMTMRLIWQIARSLNGASRFIGGQYFHRDHKGDPGAREPLVPVEPAKQREALQMILEEGLRDDVLPVPPKLLSRLSPSRWGHWGSRIWHAGFRMDFPLHDLVMWTHLGLVYRLTDPMRLSLVSELAYKQEDAVTAAEIFDGLTERVWEDLETRPLRISSFRRNLQRVHAGRLVQLWIGSAPPNSRALARMHMVDIRNRIDRALEQQLSAELRAHLEDVHARLTQALEATMEIGH